MQYPKLRGLHEPVLPVLATRHGKRMSTSQVERTVKIVAHRGGWRLWSIPMRQDNVFSMLRISSSTW